MKYSLAVFDLDGTLLDTLDDLTAACNHALAENGFTGHDAESYKQMVGNGAVNLIKRALPPKCRNDEAMLGRVLSCFQDYYDIYDRVRTRPYEGVLHLLSRLREVGVKTAVLSNKPHSRVGPLTDHFFPGALDYAQGQQSGVPMKPDPRALLAIMERFGVSPSRCLYSGDSNVDIFTGRNAGVDTVGVTWGFRTKNELIQSGALYISDKPEELLKILIDNG